MLVPQRASERASEDTHTHTPVLDIPIRRAQQTSAEPLSAAQLLDLGARYAVCPPAVLQDEIDDLLRAAGRDQTDRSEKTDDDDSSDDES